MNVRNQTDFSPLTGLLEVVGVGVEVPGRSLLQAASAQFTTGQVTAVLGPNGAGKSTLMSLLTGQRQATTGHVYLGGKALGAYAPADLARVRASVAQETQVAFEFTVREVVELGRYPHRRHPGKREVDVVLQAMQATAVGHLQHRSLNTLSGGEKARVHLARALAQVWEPVEGIAGGSSVRWLLLDEPTAALDLQHQHRMLQLVRAWATTQGVGVVAVLHDLNLALRYSDRCVVLQDGQVVGSGATAGVLTPVCIEKVWGVAAHPVAMQGGAPGPRQYLFDAAV
jgi:iron complex transport system ATP-binding protein